MDTSREEEKTTEKSCFSLYENWEYNAFTAAFLVFTNNNERSVERTEVKA